MGKYETGGCSLPNGDENRKNGNAGKGHRKILPMGKASSDLFLSSGPYFLKLFPIAVPAEVKLRHISHSNHNSYKY